MLPVHAQTVVPGEDMNKEYIETSIKFWEIELIVYCVCPQSSLSEVPLTTCYAIHSLARSQYAITNL